MKEAATVLKELPTWLQYILVVLVYVAITSWILAPLLDVVPAYILVGAVFLVDAALFWRRVPASDRSVPTLFLSCGLSACLTLLLYAGALHARNDDTYFTWVLAGVACIVVCILVLWVASKFMSDRSEETASDG